MQFSLFSWAAKSQNMILQHLNHIQACDLHCCYNNIETTTLLKSLFSRKPQISVGLCLYPILTCVACYTDPHPGDTWDELPAAGWPYPRTGRWRNHRERLLPGASQPPWSLCRFHPHLRQHREKRERHTERWGRYVFLCILPVLSS